MCKYRGRDWGRSKSKGDKTYRHEPTWDPGCLIYIHYSLNKEEGKSVGLRTTRGQSQSQ